MRDQAVKLFEAAVKAADPALALRPHLDGLPDIAGRYVLIGLGKAACAMTEEAIANLPNGAKFEAIVVTNYENDIFQCISYASIHVTQILTALVQKTLAIDQGPAGSLV